MLPSTAPRRFLSDATPGRRDPLPAVVFTAVLALYWFTSTRTPGWVDVTTTLNRARRMVLIPTAP